MLATLLASIPLMIMATGALVGVAASLVGVFLVLRRSSMLTDAISHSIVFGIVVVWLLTHQQSGPVQIVGAALTGVLTVVLTELLAGTHKVKNDAAIGLVFPVLFSVGVLLLNVYARDVHIDAHTVLLGEIGFVWLNTLSIAGHEVPQALVWMAAVTLVNAVFIVLFFKELKLTTFDPGLAKALGFAPSALFYALLLLTSSTAVAAFDAVGVVLFLAFVIVPPSAAYLLTDRLPLMLALAMAIAVLSSICGYYAAVFLDVSIGGMMAALTGVFLALAFLFGPHYGLVAQALRRRRQREINDSRLLAVHLLSREELAEGDSAELAISLRDRLAWRQSKVQQVVALSSRLDYVLADGDRLRLTEKGRRTARDLIEPWHTRAH